ncbi:MAG: hypothetical protein HQM16_19535, partial [Deltaproteobacteria bacterium]|nr:hypothetical protein [Deltaproteobacteria bacterium]
SVGSTIDGGFIFAGESQGEPVNGRDYWAVKTDADGNEEWKQRYIDGTTVKYIKQTSDNGYAIIGDGNSNDILFIKTDASGAEQHRVRYINEDASYGQMWSASQTVDNGFIIAGGIHDINSENNEDGILIKTDIDGNVEWQDTYVYGNNSIFESVEQTMDGGYVASGVTTVEDIFNTWMVKTSSDGAEEWNNILPRILDYPVALFVHQLSADRYVIAGSTSIDGTPGSSQAWVGIADIPSNDFVWNQMSNGLIYSASLSKGSGIILMGANNLAKSICLPE